ncbi:MAG: penicillin-binding transpeptidase domain-containing protein [Phycisphaerales bacterium]|jgi:penicillin-binding protein 2|nr:penicillin-binding transpeptidase domain-containing protein [Phycisphaerales bacterium]
MSTATRRKAPVMYHRRLWLLAACLGIVLVVLIVQAVRLTLVQGATHRAIAVSRLLEQHWLPTWRGSILDRKGRVLAQDEPRWEVAVSWDAITGQWAEDRAIRAARNAMGRDAWSMASPERRSGAIEAERRRWDEVLDALWTAIASAADLDRDEMDIRLNDIRSRVQRMAAVVWDAQRRRHEARFGSGEGPDFVPRPIREQADVHVIVPDLREAQAAELDAFAAEYDDLLDLRYARHRTHPYERQIVEVDMSTMPGPLRSDTVQPIMIPRVADVLLGDIRDTVWEEDVARRPFRDPDTREIDRGGYRQSDAVGSRGIEQAWEDTLRGEVGMVVRERDIGETAREEPVGGGDVQLTIDADVQARLEAVLDPDIGLTRVQVWHRNAALPDETVLPASVVVLDIATGEIIAMASSPWQLGDMTEGEVQSLQPWLIRPAQVTAPPGSIIKPMILVAAVSEGVIDVDQQIECTGHHFENQPNIARCWIYRPKYGMATHGILGPVEALARSCNSWFYELGDRLGLARLGDWLGSMGLGERLDIGLSAAWAEPLEASGSRPGGGDIDALQRQGEDTFESVMMAIGQGRTTWTPLHAANAYATLARAGRRVPPTLVRGYQPAEILQGRPLSPQLVETAITGLEDVVKQSYGTGNHLSLDSGREPIFRVQGVRIAAKTGTAQAPPWRRDVDGDGEIVSGERTTELEHSWVVGLLGDEGGPWRYAFAVLVEYGGSGGRVAGPIADQTIRAMQAEGYLSGGDS